jgi:hypothetical protein
MTNSTPSTFLNITWDINGDLPVCEAEVILVSALMQRLLEVSFEIDGQNEAAGSSTFSADKIENDRGV